MLAPANITWTETEAQTGEARGGLAALPFLATLLLCLLSPQLFDLMQRLMASLHGR